MQVKKGPPLLLYYWALKRTSVRIIIQTNVLTLEAISMEEYLIVSYNFECPVDVVIAGQHIIGLVEQLDEDDRVMISGKWYPIGEVQYV